MESPTREVEVLVPSALPSPGLPSPPPPQQQPRSSPHYLIGAQEITADRESQLGTNSRRTGTVFKGFWNDKVVAVKVLSNEIQVNVSIFRLSTGMSSIIMVSTLDFVRSYRHMGGFESPPHFARLRHL